MSNINITALVTIALFLEAIIQVLKPLWNYEAKKLAIPEVVAVCSGILIAVIGKVNMLETLIITDSVVGLYILYALSGVALGRSPSFVHDLWNKLKSFNLDKANESAELAHKLAEIIKNIFGVVEVAENENVVETEGLE